jgi:hypothetical protein
LREGAARGAVCSAACAPIVLTAQPMLDGRSDFLGVAQHENGARTSSPDRVGVATSPSRHSHEGKPAMPAITIRGIVLSAMITALAPLAAGCYVDAEVEPVAAEGYTPTYYNGYVVYYDSYGSPYYYAGDRTYYVPRTYAHYDRLTYHYRTYSPNYHRWYTNRGYRYRGTQYRGTRYRR